MKSRRLGVSFGCAVGLIAPCALGQTFGYNDLRPYESPQNFAVELRVGSYVPSIDSEFDTDHGPFWDIFSAPNANGAGRSIPWFPVAAAEFDWQIVRIGPVMSLGLGVSGGYAAMSAKSPTTASMCPGSILSGNTCPSEAASNNPAEWTLSSESTSINVIPLTSVVVARFDGLARNFQYLPIVPYVKIGLAYSFWWITSGSGIAHTSDGRDTIGGSLGWHAAVGLQVLLDAFEPRVARQLDNNSGVNHSYAFFEGYRTDLAGFLGRPQLNVGTMSWAAGVMVEF